MAATPTKQAVAGKYISKSGEDLIHLLDTSGNVLFWVDAEGYLQGKCLSQIQQVQIPNAIDAGTF